MFFILSKPTSAHHYQQSCLLINASTQLEICICFMHFNRKAFCFPVHSTTVAEIQQANPDSANVHKTKNLLIPFSWLYVWERVAFWRKK